MRNEILRWKTYEYRHREKSADWFWAVGIIAFSASAAAVIFNNIIFAIFIIVSAFTLCLLAARKPELVNVELNDQGVIINKNLYPYQNIEKYCIIIKKHGAEILLKTKKAVFPYVNIQADYEDADSIREYLSYRLKEEEMSEPLMQTIIEYLGF